jgi:16S rRNA (adenine1518-N6/adenine1519-N6)-dimethyltransferase
MQRRSLPYQQKRSLSQVFLKQTWPGQRIIERLQAWNVKRVLEIGPGPGILTKALLAENLSVTAVEKDTRFAELVGDIARTNSKLEVVNSDILKFDLAEWIGKSNERCAVVGNIPYNISSPILLWALPQLDRMAGVIIMVQLEFAQRVVAGVGTKAYGSLSVFTQLRSKTDFEAKVDRACFSPVPAVDSAIISLTPIKSEVSIDMLQKVETVTRTCFMQRRKMLRNGIKQWIKNQNEVDCPIDLNRRPETLTPAEFVRLTQFLFAEES